MSEETFVDEKKEYKNFFAMLRDELNQSRKNVKEKDMELYLKYKRSKKWKNSNEDMFAYYSYEINVMEFETEMLERIKKNMMGHVTALANHKQSLLKKIVNEQTINEYADYLLSTRTFF